MQSSSPAGSTSIRKRAVWFGVPLLIVIVIVVLLALSGHSNITGGATEQTAGGLEYRNPVRGITVTAPPSWVVRPSQTKAVALSSRSGCSVLILSHLVFIPTSAYERGVEVDITETHVGQTYSPYTSWQGSRQPDIAVHADLRHSGGTMVAQNYIHFRKGTSIVSLIETLPSLSEGCPAQIASIERSFRLD